MKDCSAEPTPIASGFVFTKKDCPATESEQFELKTEARWYRTAVASCLYLSTWTRPDLSYAISKFCKFMSNPGKSHIRAVKRLLRHLKGTIDRCLSYDFSKTPARTGVYGFHDSAHADDVDTRRSTMAYLFFLEGCSISWHSKLHSYVTVSTNHSEYVISAKAAREARWLGKIFTGLGFSRLVTPIDLFSDSTGAIAMNYNPVNHSASKHVELADHYAREQISRGFITISYVPTKQMIADFLTKQLPRAQAEYLIHLAGLRKL